MKKFYVIHHTLRGTPESGEIYAVYATKRAATKALKAALKEEYDVTPEENEEEYHEYMYMSVQKFYAN